MFGARNDYKRFLQYAKQILCLICVSFFSFFQILLFLKKHAHPEMQKSVKFSPPCVCVCVCVWGSVFVSGFAKCGIDEYVFGCRGGGLR